MELILHLAKLKLGFVLLGLGFFIEGFAGEHMLKMSDLRAKEVGFSIMGIGILYEIIVSAVIKKQEDVRNQKNMRRRKEKHRRKKINLLHIIVRELNYIERQIDNRQEVRSDKIQEHELMKYFAHDCYAFVEVIRNIIDLYRDYDNVYRIATRDSQKKEKEEKRASVIKKFREKLKVAERYVGSELNKLGFSENIGDLRQIEKELEKNVDQEWEGEDDE